MKTSGRDVVADQAKNFNVIVSSSASLCDNTQRNLLHLNNGIAVDQQQPTPSIVYSNSQLRAIRIKAEDGQTHHLHGKQLLNNIQHWPKETLQVLFYEAKFTTSDGYSNI